MPTAIYCSGGRARCRSARRLEKNRSLSVQNETGWVCRFLRLSSSRGVSVWCDLFLWLWFFWIVVKAKIRKIWCDRGWLVGLVSIRLTISWVLCGFWEVGGLVRDFCCSAVATVSPFDFEFGTNSVEFGACNSDR